MARSISSNRRNRISRPRLGRSQSKPMVSAKPQAQAQTRPAASKKKNAAQAYQINRETQTKVAEMNREATTHRQRILSDNELQEYLNNPERLHKLRERADSGVAQPDSTVEPGSAAKVEPASTQRRAEEKASRFAERFLDI